MLHSSHFLNFTHQLLLVLSCTCWRGVLFCKGFFLDAPTGTVWPQSGARTQSQSVWNHRITSRLKRLLSIWNNDWRCVHFVSVWVWVRVFVCAWIAGVNPQLSTNIIRITPQRQLVQLIFFFTPCLNYILQTISLSYPSLPPFTSPHLHRQPTDLGIISTCAHLRQFALYFEYKPINTCLMWPSLLLSKLSFMPCVSVQWHCQLWVDSTQCSVQLLQPSWWRRGRCTRSSTLSTLWPCNTQNTPTLLLLPPLQPPPSCLQSPPLHLSRCANVETIHALSHTVLDVVDYMPFVLYALI